MKNDLFPNCSRNFKDQLTRVYTPLLVEQLNAGVPLYDAFSQRPPDDDSPWAAADAWERSLSRREDIKRMERVAWMQYQHEQKVDRAFALRESGTSAAPPRIAPIDFLAIT